MHLLHPNEETHLDLLIADRSLFDCEHSPTYLHYVQISRYVMETVAFVNHNSKDSLERSDIDPINEVEAIIYTRGKAQNLAMNAYRVKLQNALRIAYRMIASVQFDSCDRVLVRWTPQGGYARSEIFWLDRVENVIDRVLSISHGEKTATSMGMTFNPGVSTLPRP